MDALPHFDRWRGTDAEWLVMGRVKKLDHRLLAEFRLWNVVKGQPLSESKPLIRTRF
jgi:hypothetical protein